MCLDDIKDVLENKIDSKIMNSRIKVILYEMSVRRDSNLTKGEELLFMEFFKIGFAAAHVLGDREYLDE